MKKPGVFVAVISLLMGLISFADSGDLLRSAVTVAVGSTVSALVVMFDARKEKD